MVLIVKTIGMGFANLEQVQSSTFLESTNELWSHRKPNEISKKQTRGGKEV